MADEDASLIADDLLQYNLGPAITTCEYVAATERAPDMPWHAASHRVAASVLRRVQSLDVARREELLRKIERVDMMELLGMKRRTLYSPNMTVAFRNVGALQKGWNYHMSEPSRFTWFPLRLTVDPACAHAYDIESVEDHGAARRIFRGRVSARMCPPAPASDSDWPFENLDHVYPIQLGADVVVRVTATVDDPPPFAGLIFGHRVMDGVG
jgi:hypothetical protein